ncbi:MAG TPA: ATP-binding protein [Thermoanaerobaculia bacterium]|nr:ATP-binding protein [Thermoanaerobaculia bacterium]
MSDALRSALDAVPVGVGLIAEDRRVLYANARLAAMLHTEIDTLIGSDLASWLAEPVRPASARRMHARFLGPPVELGARFTTPEVDAYIVSALTSYEGAPAALFLATDVAESGSRGEDKQVLDMVAAAVSSKVGDDFFSSLVLALTRSLAVDYALVAEVADDGRRAHVIAGAAGDEVMGAVEYELDGTPCAEVLRSDICWHVQGVQQQFPRDRMLVDMGAEAYAAVPLRDAAGEAIGLLAILHKSRLPVYGHLQSALQIVAVRAAAELERRQRERDLQRAHRYLDDLIETANVLVVEIDIAGRLLRANRCFEQTTGWTRAELQDDGWLERLQPPDRFPAATADVRRYLREGRWPREVDAPLLTRDGEERTISWRNSAVRDEKGRVIGTLSVGADVTDKLRAIAEREKLQESLRRSATLSAVGSLVAGVAHEVRNPLFGIAATLDAFEAEIGTSPAAREYVDVLRNDLGRLRRLMDDLLVYGRPLTLARQVQPLQPLVAEALRSVRPRAQARGVELKSELEEHLPQVPLDADRMLQVLANLLENAVELCAPEGEVVVSARYEPGDPPLLVCAVRDQGPGFRSEDLPRLFEPFFSRRRGGSGLGLAIVQKIVGDHGGEVTAGNAPGGGAVVEVRLPVLGGMRHAARQSAAG